MAEIWPATTCLQSAGPGAPGHEAVEGYREGVRVETSKSRAPSVKRLCKEKATDAVLAFLRDTRVGCISIRRKPPEEECDGEGEDGGEGESNECISYVSFFSLRGTIGAANLFLCYFICVGYKRKVH